MAYDPTTNNNIVLLPSVEDDSVTACMVVSVPSRITSEALTLILEKAIKNAQANKNWVSGDLAPVLESYGITICGADVGPYWDQIARAWTNFEEKPDE